MCERCRSFYILSDVTYLSPYFRENVAMCPRKASCPVFVLCRDASNTICDLALYDGLNILIHDGTIPLQCFKTVVAMQDSTLLETGSRFIFFKSAAPMRG